MTKTVLVAGILVAAMVAIVGGVALWDYHEEPEFCAAFCHIMDPYLASWEESDFQVYAHAEVDLACLDCHEPTIQEQVKEAAVFVMGQFEDPLRTRRFPDEFCLQCHEHGSLDEIIERTKDYAILNENHNPHDPHPDKDESIVKQFECWNCHTMHKRSAGTEYCFSSCHHERTFEGCGSVDCH